MKNKTIPLKDIAAQVGGAVVGNPDTPIDGVAGIREAQSGEITFLSNAKYLVFLKSTQASAVILGKEEKEVSCSQLIVENPYYAFARILHLFNDRPKPKPGIHPKAHMGDNVRTGRDVSIGPLAVVEDGVELGDRVTIYPGVYIGPRARIGDETILYANVTVADGVRIGKRVIVHSGTVIGGDGFGFASHEGMHHKIPQVGSVVVEDDVEIGANVAIDRGALGDTRIGRGTKIDNLVQIAHNVQIGENGLLVSQVGISGSVKIGKNVTLAGQTGVAGHLNIGDKVISGGRAGIVKDVPPGQVVSGFPAIPHRRWLESATLFSKLPEFRKRIKALEKQVRVQEEQVSEDQPKGKNND